MKFKLLFTEESQAADYKKHLEKCGLEPSIAKEEDKFSVNFETATAGMDYEKAEQEFDMSDAAQKQMMDMMSCEMANMWEKVVSFISYEMDYMENRFRYMWDEINYIYKMFYEHKENGHLPPIKGAGKMEKALETLGIGDDYDVRKQVIFASKNSGVPNRSIRTVIEGMKLPENLRK